MRGKVFLLTILATAILIVVAVLFFCEPVEEPRLSSVTPRLDAESAFKNIHDLCTEFPRRSIYHPDNAKAAAWLRKYLELLGLEVGTQAFGSWAGDRYVEGLTNVYGISRGTVKPEEIIIVTSHFDIPEFVLQGAADAGSDVGIIMELARVFAAEEHARTIIFLFTNNEEYGMQGAAAFVEQYPHLDRVVAVLSMDYMNMGEMDYILARFTGLHKGYTPLWLRELAVAAAAQEAPVRSTGPLMEWVERAVTISSTDAGIFMAAGVPTVNITSRAKDAAWQREIYHSPQDTVDKLSKAAVSAYGRTAERILRSVDEMPAIPAAEMTYFKYNENAYLPGWVVTALQLLLFAPLLALLIADFKAAAPWTGIAFSREITRALFIFLSGLAAYLVLRFLPQTEWMVRYPLYPATQKDPVLYNPQYFPTVLVLLAVLLAALFLFQAVYRLLPKPDRPETGIGLAGRWWLLLALLALAVTVWAEGSGFAAVAFFLLPAYLWPWIIPGRSLPRRFLNLLLTLAGGTVFFVFIYIFATTYQIGVMWWYILLAAACGLFSWKVVLVFLAAVSLLLSLLGVSLRAHTTSGIARYLHG